MNYSKEYSNVNRSVTQSRDVVKHMLFLYFVRGIKYMQNVVVFFSFFSRLWPNDPSKFNTFTACSFD